MHRHLIIGLLVALLFCGPVDAQGLSEFGAVQAGAAGLGAGLAASQNHGALIKSGFATAEQLQAAAEIQTKAIQQYVALGQGFEAKKQWDSAEKAFKYVLQVICKRDGPGSPESLPALKHLVVASKGLNKIDQAISYQKTVIAFAHAAPKKDLQNLIKEEGDLSDLYVFKGDYAQAEPLLKQQLQQQEKAPNVTPQQRVATLKVYGRVLRELNKASEADNVDAAVQNIDRSMFAGNTPEPGAEPAAVASGTATTGAAVTSAAVTNAVTSAAVTNAAVTSAAVTSAAVTDAAATSSIPAASVVPASASGITLPPESAVATPAAPDIPDAAPAAAASPMLDGPVIPDVPIGEAAIAAGASSMPAAPAAAPVAPAQASAPTEAAAPAPAAAPADAPAASAAPAAAPAAPVAPASAATSVSPPASAPASAESAPAQADSSAPVVEKPN